MPQQYFSNKCSTSSWPVKELPLLTANSNNAIFLRSSHGAVHTRWIPQEAHDPCTCCILWWRVQSIVELNSRAVYNMHVVVSRHNIKLWLHVVVSCHIKLWILDAECKFTWINITTNIFQGAGHLKWLTNHGIYTISWTQPYKQLPTTINSTLITK